MTRFERLGTPFASAGKNTPSPAVRMPSRRLAKGRQEVIVLSLPSNLSTNIPLPEMVGCVCVY